MRYFAGKSKFAKRIARAILHHTPRRLEYFEPFVGGGSVLACMSKHFLASYASDNHCDLVLMWQAIMADWLPPTHVSEAEYRQWKNQPSSAERGFVGFSCSFGGKWFGPYARFIKPDGSMQNFADEGCQNLIDINSKLRNCTFERMTYDKIVFSPKAVIYCDPPYANTYAGLRAFDTPKFWEWARGAAATGAHVYVSEFIAPLDWVPIWQFARPNMMGRLGRGKRLVEKVFVHESQFSSHHG